MPSHSIHRDGSAKGLINVGLFIATILAIGCSCLALFLPEALYAAVGIAAFVIVLIPVILDRDYDLFSPWSFIIVSVVFGCTLRGIYMSLNLPDPETADFMFFLGESPQFFLYPSMLLLVGLVCLSAGYTLFQRRFGPRQYIESWRPRPFWTLCMLVIVLSLYATYEYVYLTGGFDWNVLSAKRTTISDIDIQEDSEYRGYGVLRQLGKFALFAHLVVLANLSTAGTRHRGQRMVCGGLLLMIACLIPFYSSNRSDVAMALLTSLVTWSYLQSRLPIGRLLVVVIGLAGVIHAMSVLRSAAENGQSLPSTIGSAFDPLNHFVVSRNGLGIEKTAHVINAVPSVLDVEWGRTIWVWIFAPIPREMWPEKPLIHCGPIIGHFIYGTRVSGVPPGIVAELYWNFLWPGVIIGCFVFGTLLRMSYDSLSPQGSRSPTRVLLYVVGPMNLSWLVVGATIGAGLCTMIVDMASMKLVLMFVIARQRAPKRAMTRNTTRGVTTALQTGAALTRTTLGSR